MGKRQEVAFSARDQVKTTHGIGQRLWVSMALILTLAACQDQPRPSVSSSIGATLPPSTQTQVIASASPSGTVLKIIPPVKAQPVSQAEIEPETPAPTTEPAPEISIEVIERLLEPDQGSAETEPLSSPAETTIALLEDPAPDNDTEALSEDVLADDNDSIALILSQFEAADAAASDAEETETVDLPINSNASNDVVWTIDANSPPAPITTAENEGIIPEGKDPSLAEDALAAAFKLVRQSAKLNDGYIQTDQAAIQTISKAPNTLRAAMLMPLGGRAKAIGLDMRRGAELALFTLASEQIDLTFHDTSQGIEAAVADAIAHDADLIIGPLFAENTRIAQSLAASAGIPVLSFSNDSTVAKDGVWLLGQTPEQDLETVLLQAFYQVKPIARSGRAKPHMAIIAQTNDYGKRISQFAIDMTRKHDKVTADLMTLDDDILADEKVLRQSIKNLTGWRKRSENAKPAIPRYDLVLIAGDVPFTLRVAPVLSWYDLDPERVQYLGTSIWNNAAILQEPSLSRAWFADLPTEKNDRFQAIWQRHFDQPASKPALLAFDAVVLASTLDYQSSQALKDDLLSSDGFSGFSGMFKLGVNGENKRLLEILQIENGQARVIIPAGQQF